MARRPAKPKAATAAKPQNTEGTDDSLKGAQATDQAEVPQQPSDTNGGGQAAAIAPPDPETPPADPASAVEAPTAETSLSAVMSAVVPAVPLAEVPSSVKALSEPKTEPQGVLVVTGPKRGRWRAGWHFGPEPRRIPLAGLTEDERAAIEGDPALTAIHEAEIGAA